MKKILVLLFVSLVFHQARAQFTVYQNSVDKEFNQALELFQKDQYAASKSSFEYLKEKPLDEAQSVDVAFYHAASALYIENPDGPSLLSDFLSKYPKQPKSNDAAYILGDYYFGQRNYKSAIEYYRMVNTNQTSIEQRAEVLFKTGYSFFQLKNHKNAAVYFEQVKPTRSAYVPGAFYYSGYMAMQAGDFPKAVQNFKEAEKSNLYAPKIPYMLSALYYRQGDFTSLEDYATPILNTRKNLEKREEIYLLLAEASFENKNYVNAASYYDTYAKGSKVALTRDQRYKAGVAHYEVGDFQQASNYFKE